MAPRPTQEIILPDGSIVTLKTYLTVREEDEIQGVWTQDAEIRNTGKGVEVTGVKGISGLKARNKIFEMLIVSIVPAGESAGNHGAEITDPKQILEWILELPKTVYNPLQQAVNKITDPKDS